MANIKFSDFTVGNTEGDIDFVVGYKGANNIQISPTNLLASALGNYLPLAGGTMTGDIILNDDVRLRAGTGSDFSFFHNGSNSKINNNTGNIEIENFQDDGDIIFKSDDGSGGSTEYFRVDGGQEKTLFIKNTEHQDSAKAQFGDSGDFGIFHNGTNTFLENDTGGLYIRNNTDDKDIIFEADNGSGGVAEYFKLDGSLASGGALFTRFPDNSNLGFGNSNDLRIYHNGTNTNIENFGGTLQIIQNVNDGDIKFLCDNGSGATTTYFFLDGSGTRTIFEKLTRHNDDIYAAFGTDSDLRIFHDGSDSYIKQVSSATGNLYIQQDIDDTDMLFQADNGSGAIGTYFYLDGSGTNGSTILGATIFPDKSKIYMGTSGDLELFHDGTNTFIENYTGAFFISQLLNDGDLIFQCDDGSGGVTEYFRLDGSATQIKIQKETVFADNVKADFGAGADLQIYHNGTNSVIDNITGDLFIRQFTNDGDIKFQSDDGSGGTTEYFRVDGDTLDVRFSKPILLFDNVNLKIGTGQDLELRHDATDSYIQNSTGNLNIINFANDKDIIFKSDDGSGGTAEYLRLDGSLGYMVSTKQIAFVDNAMASFGGGADLQIFHDASNSYIQDTGTGNLFIQGSNSVFIRSVAGETYARFDNNDTAILYNNGVEKIRTIGSGVRISGVSEYADNTAAIAGGLTTGDVYRTGDLLKIVH